MGNWENPEHKIRVIGFDCVGEKKESTFANEEEAYEWATNHGVSIEFIMPID